MRTGWSGTTRDADAALSPTPEIRAEIEKMLKDVVHFANQVHSGAVKPPGRARFTRVLWVSYALGPQFVAEALSQKDDKLKLVFLDNTDPDGFDRVLGANISETLTVVISKSGSTPETLNGMLEAAHAYKKQGLDFSKYAVAVTGDGSVLFKQAQADGWLGTFPMWDWVGGRTSIWSAVGLVGMALRSGRPQLPARSQRDRRLERAPKSGRTTRPWRWRWPGTRSATARVVDMVVLPYKDRLALFSRYLQQLVMDL